MCCGIPGYHRPDHIHTILLRTALLVEFQHEALCDLPRPPMLQCYQLLSLIMGLQQRFVAVGSYFVVV